MWRKKFCTFQHVSPPNLPQQSLPWRPPRHAVPQAGDGKLHHYWALVESHRTARGPRQRVVAYLGEMDEVPLTGLGVQQAAQNHPGHQTALRDDTTPEWVEVNVRAVRTVLAMCGWRWSCSKNFVSITSSNKR